MYRIIQ